jgi:hypothetical protein
VKKLSVLFIMLSLVGGFFIGKNGDQIISACKVFVADVGTNFDIPYVTKSLGGKELGASDAGPTEVKASD